MYRNSLANPLVSLANRKDGQQGFLEIGFLFPISVTPDHHHADTFLALVIKSTGFFLAYE